MNGIATGGNVASRLAVLVAQLQTELNRVDRIGATALGVGTAEDLQVLRLLLSDGPLRVGEIARRRASSATAASGRLDRLERKKLIRRERVQGDRRAMVATLTKSGTKAAAISSTHRTQMLGEIADDFPTEALEHLVATILAAEDPYGGPKSSSEKARG